MLKDCVDPHSCSPTTQSSRIAAPDHRYMLPRQGSQHRYANQSAAMAEASIKAAVSNHGQRCSFTLRPHRFLGSQVPRADFQNERLMLDTLPAVWPASPVAFCDDLLTVDIM